MAEVINLRQRRKAKARAERQKMADDNRIRHGRRKAECELTRAQSELEAQRLSGHKLNDKDD